MVKDLLEGIVRQCCHGMGIVSVPHADGMVDGLQDTPKSVHVHIRGLGLGGEEEGLNREQQRGVKWQRYMYG